MNEKRRNLLVGLTVIVALGLLGWMIIRFQELPSWARTGYEVRVVVPSSGGMDTGADVRLSGMRIGRVAEIAFAADDPTKGVSMTLAIDHKFKIPAQVNPYIQGGGWTGGDAVVLMVDGKEPGASRQGQWLPTDEPITLYQPKETGDGGSGMLPHSLVQRFKKTLDKLDTALDSVNKVIGDEANRQNIKAALAEFRAASAKMKDLAQSGESAFKTYDKLGGRLLEEIDKFGKVMATFEHKLAPKLVDDADRFGELLTALTNTARKLNSDKGTAGKLLNDPKLYNELIDTFATLRKMLEKWDTEGVNLKMSR